PPGFLRTMAVGAFRGQWWERRRRTSRYGSGHAPPVKEGRPSRRASQRGPLAVEALLLDPPHLPVAEPEPGRDLLALLDDAHRAVLGGHQRQEHLHPLVLRQGLVRFVLGHDAILRVGCLHGTRGSRASGRRSAW